GLAAAAVSVPEALAQVRTWGSEKGPRGVGAAGQPRPDPLSPAPTCNPGRANSQHFTDEEKDSEAVVLPDTQLSVNSTKAVISVHLVPSYLQHQAHIRYHMWLLPYWTVLVELAGRIEKTWCKSAPPLRDHPSWADICPSPDSRQRGFEALLLALRKVALRNHVMVAAEPITATRPSSSPSSG
ncbi:hypothetical protein J1605_006401, partial [Eschrichtius robustus]